MMLRFCKLENFLSLFISAYLYVILLKNWLSWTEYVGDCVHSKSMVSISSTLIFSPSMEIVPNLQRELNV